jgi:ParB family chromosome partitioning protein
MEKHKGVLGRGLSALIPPGEARVTRPIGVAEIPVDRVLPNPHQPRQAFDPEALAELAASIRTHGVLQPLVVTQAGDHYQIIAGDRRWRAARLAGLRSVPAVIKETTPQQMLALALVENIQRADLNPLEEAGAFRQLMDEFGLTQDQVAEQVGKSRAAVANIVRLLRLPDEVKEALAAGLISEGHARALLALPTAATQQQGLATIQRHDLNVRQTESMVRRMLGEPDEAGFRAAAPALSPQDRDVIDRFQRRLGTRVNLVRGKRGGRLVIHFYSEEEFQAIYEAVLGAEG